MSQFIGTKGAMRLAGISRSTLHRHCTPAVSSKGRIQSLWRMSDVKALKARREVK